MKSKTNAFKPRFPLGVIWQYLTIILKASVIRFTPENLRCDLLGSFNIIKDSDEIVIFLPLAVMFKKKRRMREKENIGYQIIFGQREEKGSCSNLKRNETSQ